MDVITGTCPVSPILQTVGVAYPNGGEVLALGASAPDHVVQIRLLHDQQRGNLDLERPDPEPERSHRPDGPPAGGNGGAGPPGYALTNAIELTLGW